MEPFGKAMASVAMAVVIGIIFYLFYDSHQHDVMFRDQCNRAGGVAAIPTTGINKCMREGTILYDDSTK